MDQPWDVQVTLIRAPRRRPSRVHVIAVLIGLAIAVAVAGALRAGARQTTRTAALASVYRYPLGCLGASLSGAGRASTARRGGPCWRYGVYVTAILRRDHGTWGLALEAVSPSCPAVPLPALARVHLAVCIRARVG